MVMNWCTSCSWRLYKETSLPGIQLMVWWGATSVGSHCGSVLIPVRRDSVPHWISSDAVRLQAMINHQPRETTTLFIFPDKYTLFYYNM